jgi:hypothetical protein
MKTNTFKILVTWAAFAALVAPLQAAQRNPRDSRHPDPGGRPQVRHFQPQGGGHGRHEYRPSPRPPVVAYWGYYPPPPPPPPQMIYWGYPPPPPPPPPVYYPYPRPGFNIVLTF